MMKTIRFGVLLACASALVAPPALAQVRNLDGEQSDVRVFQGQLSGEPAVFSVTVPADTALQIDVIATGDLDPVLRVLEASGDLIVEDDDGGDDLNSRARIGAEDRSRQITIEVDSFNADWAKDESYGGAFDLRLATSEYVEVGTRAVTYGASETGTLLGEEHLFTMQGAAGQLVEIALIATDDKLDPYLELRDASGETIAFDDDGDEGYNSLMRHTFDDSGTYTIAARGFGDDHTGAYRLRVREQRQAVAQLPLQVIGMNDRATGELASDWGDGGDGSMMPSHIDYQLSDSAKSKIRSGNGEVTIRMNATGSGDPDFGGEIDPYIEVGYDTPLGFAVVASDDDGGGELNSMLPLDLGLIADQGGLLDMLRIRAQGYGGSSGAYSLEITEGMDAPAAPPIMLED